MGIGDACTDQRFFHFSMLQATQVIGSSFYCSNSISYSSLATTLLLNAAPNTVHHITPRTSKTTTCIQQDQLPLLPATLHVNMLATCLEGLLDVRSVYHLIACMSKLFATLCSKSKQGGCAKVSHTTMKSQKLELFAPQYQMPTHPLAEDYQERLQECNTLKVPATAWQHVRSNHG